MNLLPNELLEIIFGYCIAADNAQTLCSICLASQRFYHVAQPLLYTSIQLHVQSAKLQLLYNSLRTKTQLAAAVKDLSLECRAAYVSTNSQSLLRRFLQTVLPSLTGLVTLRGHHRFITTRLIESTLYKEGNGYHMSVPTDLTNLEVLELFAADYVYKYNYVLRLPRLRRVFLTSVKVIEVNDEDTLSPSDWGWTSQSIKELVLHLEHREPELLGSHRLRSNALQALSRSMPHLESLRIEHHDSHLKPWLCRGLAAVFASQLAGSLRRLELHDGRLDTSLTPQLGSYMAQVDDVAAVDKIQASGLEHLSIDWNTLVLATTSSDIIHDPFHVACPLTTLRSLTFRYADVEVRGVYTWALEFILEHLQQRFPALEKICLELRLTKKIDSHALQDYATVFVAAGIDFEVRTY
jgi:hypothetical protein